MTVPAAPKLCECGCGTPVLSARPAARYASGACRTRDWKRRTGYRDTRRRQASRNASRRRRSPPSVRISYRKAVAAVATALVEGVQRFEEISVAEQEAAAILEPLLTPAGRRALRG